MSRVVTWLCLGVMMMPSLGSAQEGKKYTRAQFDADQALVMEVADVMIAKMKRPPNMKWPPLVRLVESDIPNAFATFDAKDPEQPVVEIHVRWMQEIVQGDPHVLAITMGHELGHHHYDHARKLRDKAAFARFAMTRAQETEADEFGAKLLLESGFSLRRAIAGDAARLVNFNKRHFSTLDALETTHPAWLDRFERMSKEPEFWRAMSAFANGVTFLTAEHHSLAAECFDRVLKEFPACYEGWNNRGYAYLMLYFDGLSTKDLKDYDVGQVLCRGFFERIESLQPPTRGRDPTNWNEAVSSFQRALKLKPDLALTKSNLGLAYLFHPEGKKVTEALAYLKEAQAALAKETNPDASVQAGVLVNLGVAYLAGNDTDAGERELDKALTVSRRLAFLEGGLVENIILYNQAMALARSEKGPGRAAAITKLEQYLRNSYSLSAWWTVALERYVELCKEAGRTPRGRDELLKPGESLIRPAYAIELPGGEKVTLAEPTDAALRRLGKARETQVVGKALRRLTFVKHGIELVATDQVLAVVLDHATAPPLTLQTRDVGKFKQFQLKVGQSRKEVYDNLGQAIVTRQLFESGPEYTYYRQLGLAIRYDQPHPEGRIVEIVLARVPDGK